MIKAGQTYPISVLSVRDGDSVVVRCESWVIEIRLRGIDAPELGQEFGDESRTYLDYLVHHASDIQLEVVDPNGMYDRVIGWLYGWVQGRKVNLNVEMVRRGMAYAYMEYGGEDKRIQRAERIAKDGRIGVWCYGPHGGEKPWGNRHDDDLTRLAKGFGRMVGNWFS